mmetsp:Transcript_10011/g.19561  ORF Transcript_10011/g.19561 Transcript_10011/m.19561 type:complete len:212 (+) Transcript_10011:1065-1700(+)
MCRVSSRRRPAATLFPSTRRCSRLLRSTPRWCERSRCLSSFTSLIQWLPSLHRTRIMTRATKPRSCALLRLPKQPLHRRLRDTPMPTVTQRTPVAPSGPHRRRRGGCSECPRPCRPCRFLSCRFPRVARRRLRATACRYSPYRTAKATASSSRPVAWGAIASRRRLTGLARGCLMPSSGLVQRDTALRQRPKTCQRWLRRRSRWRQMPMPC